MNNEGYVVIDHRASPGLSLELAQKLGMPAGSTFYEAATLHCHHCGGHVRLNPDRVRARTTCAKCGNGYICDGCAEAAAQPAYIHRSAKEIIDMVRSGRWTIVGGPAGAPHLIPVEELSNG